MCSARPKANRIPQSTCCEGHGLTLETIREVMGGIVDEIAIERQQRLRWHIGIKPDQTRRIWRRLVEAFKQWKRKDRLAKT